MEDLAKGLTENMFSISFRKHHDEEKGKQLVNFDYQNVILFARAIITVTSTAHASSVSIELQKHDF